MDDSEVSKIEITNDGKNVVVEFDAPISRLNLSYLYARVIGQELIHHAVEVMFAGTKNKGKGLH